MANGSGHEGGVPPEGGKVKRRRRNPMQLFEDFFVVFIVASRAPSFEVFVRDLNRGLRTMRNIHFAKRFPLALQEVRDGEPPTDTQR